MNSFPSGLLRALSRLSSSSASFRPGTSIPASNAPLHSAPPKWIGARSAAANRGVLRRSLSSASAEGAMAEIVAASTAGAVLTGWALYLGCTPILIGLLGALPFLAQGIQLPAVWLTARFGKRRTAILAVALSRQALLPLVVLPFLPISPASKQVALLAIGGVSSILAVIGNNAWIEWMGDLVPSGVHGRYFGRRTAVCALSGTVASLFAGIVLDRSGSDLGPPLAALAALACLAGAASTILMRRQHDPLPEAAGSPAPALRDAWKPLLDSGSRRFLLYLLAWNAALGIASTFYAVHMLENLRMGFALVAAYGAAVAAMRILGAPIWGRVIDRVGARPVMLTCSFALTLLPAMWLFTTPDRLWPVAVDALFAGFLWSGHTLAAFALPFAVTPRTGRRFYLATFSTAAGLAFAAACTLGGAIAEALPVQFTVAGLPMYDLHVLFLLSSAARLAASAVGLRILQPGARPLDSVVPQLRLELATLSKNPFRRSRTHT